ncbi:tetratricopeptide repeat protein [Prochlorococcus marinus]|nr:tetratricopeptide repeat protein [Prochlorococcus marinus]
MNKEFKEAINLYSEAIKLDYRDPFSFNNRGSCYEEIKDYSKAINDYSKAIKRNSKEIQFYLNRAEAHDKNQNYKDAIRDYTKYLKKKNNEDVLSRRAYLRYLIGNYKLAIKDYEKLSTVFDQATSEILLKAKRLQKEIDANKAFKEIERTRKQQEEKDKYRDNLSYLAEFNTDLDVNYVEENRSMRELILAAGLDETNREGPSSEIVNEIFPAGIYIIDDLFRRSPDQTNREEEHSYEGIGFEVNGISTGDRGSKFSNIETLFGEGDYKDNYGNSYEVEGSSIGCISHREVNISDNELVAIFPKPFNINYDRTTGIIRFGSVFIDTDYRYMGQRKSYFYDSKNLYEPDHPDNTDNKTIEVLFKEYYEVKELDPKPLEKINWKVAKLIERQLDLNAIGVTNKLLKYFADKLKGLKEENESKLGNIIRSYLDIAKKDIKEWSLSIYKEASITMNSQANLDAYGRSTKTVKLFFDEKILLKEIQLSRVGRIIDECIHLLREIDS